MKISSNDVVRGGRCRIPKDRYRVRVVKTDFKTSSSGHPMTVLGYEIIDPETVNVDGEEFKIAGRQGAMYLMHNTGESWGHAKVEEFMKKTGVAPEDGEYDTDLHKEYFLGLEFDIVLSSEEDVKRYTPKPGQKIGDPIRDAEGKPISNGWVLRADISDVPVHCNPTRVEMAF